MKSSYFEERLEPDLEAAILADWCDSLEDWPIEQIKWALRQHREARPDRKPNPGHISAILITQRGIEAAKRAEIGKAEDEPRPKVSDDERRAQQAKLQEILGQLRNKKPQNEGSENDHRI